MFILDTDVLSELRRPAKADPNVLAWAGRNSASDFFISSISVLELETGVLLVERKDPAQGMLLRTWFEQQVLTGFGDRILAIDAAVARRCARLHVPNRRAERDALIAATALVHGMAVVTRNTRDFLPMGVTVVDPWLP